MLKICTNWEFWGLNNKPSTSCQFNGSYLRACMKLRIVQKIRFSLLESGRTKPWCPGLVSRLSVPYFELSFLVVSLFIFPTGPTALDSEPCGRRYVKNMGHDRNRVYSKAIHSPTSMEMHYVQWFLLKSVYEFTDCAKKLDFAFLSLGGPRHGARVWCLGWVPKHRNQWTSGKNQRACYLAPKTQQESSLFKGHPFSC